MANKPQNAQNHARIDPLFHYFLMPVGLFLFIASVYYLVRHPAKVSATVAVAALWAYLALFKIRLYALKVQDRVIRLEERLRIEKLVPAPLRDRAYELTEQQLIALRFASDGELPALMEKTLSGNLAPKAIKTAVQSWRPDYWRV